MQKQKKIIPPSCLNKKEKNGSVGLNLFNLI